MSYIIIWSPLESVRLALSAPEEKSIVQATEDKATTNNPRENFTHLPLPLPPGNQQPFEHQKLIDSTHIIEVPATPELIVEVPTTPEQKQIQAPEIGIEDFEDPNEIPMIELNVTEFTQNVKKYVEKNMQTQRIASVYIRSRERRENVQSRHRWRKGEKGIPL
ncbi:hypothetical protein BC332_08970 [Capsicum chinense]|nr:hypothetical protein BC332_08970 [Capsicum chinense]